MEVSNCIVSTLRHAVHTLVKEAQANGGDITKDNAATNSLCSAIEAILLNGQEVQGYRKMFKKIGFTSPKQAFECCFWEYLQYYLPRDLVRTIKSTRIMETRTEIGCCRVWVRLSLNEGTLCNFFDAMRADEERTSQFYTASSLMRDQDRMEAALGLLRMVESECRFDLDYKTWELNSWTLSTGLSLANVRYVVPPVTLMRRHGYSSADQRFSSLPPLRPPSLSSPEPSRVDREPFSASIPADSSEAPSPDPPPPKDSCDGSMPCPRKGWLEAKGSQDSNTAVVRSPASSLARLSPPSSPPAAPDLGAALTEGDQLAGSAEERPTPMSVEDRVALNRAFSMPDKVPAAGSSSDGAEGSPVETRFRLLTRLKNEGHSTSPHDLYCQLEPLRSMSPNAVVAEALRRGLLVSSSSLEEAHYEDHSRTLIRAVEEHRRRECEVQFEEWQREEEQKGKFAPGTPPPSTTASNASSWDHNVMPSSSSPSELAPQSISTPEMIDDDREEFDEFAIFPRRRVRNESEDIEALGAEAESSSHMPRPQSMPFCLDHSGEDADLSLSTSWNQDRRVYRMKASPATGSTSGRSPPHDVPSSEGIIERIVANLPGARRGSASHIISRIGAAVSTVSSYAVRGTNESTESDDEWELVGDEFMAKKNARTKRLIEIHPGAERVPDPQHDFADTNCTRCRGHIIGRLRHLDHYDGRWYCGRCHEGATAIIPRDVLTKWDFTEKPVATETKVALTKMFLQPNIDVMKKAPGLYSLCPDLKEVTRARHQLAFLWQYVCDCPSGIARTMSRMLIPRERLIGSVMEIHLYSLEDLTLVHCGGALLKLVHHVLRDGLKHARACTACQTSRQHFCDNCGARVPLYELDTYMKCITATCDGVIHTNCFRHHPDDFWCRECSRKKANKVPLHETYDAVFSG